MYTSEYEESDPRECRVLLKIEIVEVKKQYLKVKHHFTKG